MSKAPIFFISGAPGVGKSTTARALANHFEKSILFDIDYFRSLVVKGLRQPTSGWDDEVESQFRLAHEAVGKVAKTYSDAGFAVIAEHCSGPEMVETFIKSAGLTVVVCLRASMETNLARNLMRTNKSFDPKDIEHFVLSLGDSLFLEFEQAGYPVLDTTKLSVEEVLMKVDATRGSSERLD
jgi:cytidylate kinase